MDVDNQIRIVLTVILSFAVIFDALFLIFSFRHKIGTRLCTLLLRSQTAIDSLLMVFNLFNIQYFRLIPLPPQSLPDALWFVYCKLVSSEMIHWSLVSMSVYNLVCIAIERCCCLCAPFWYRQRKSLLLKLFCIVVVASPFVMEVPYCWSVATLQTQPVGDGNDTWLEKYCDISFRDEQMMKSFGIAYVTIFWILPSVLSVVLYLVVMRTIRQSSAVQSSASAEGKVTSASRRLTLMTGFTSAAFVLLFAMDSMDYFLIFMPNFRGFVGAICACCMRRQNSQIEGRASKQMSQAATASVGM